MESSIHTNKSTTDPKKCLRGDAEANRIYRNYLVAEFGVIIVAVVTSEAGHREM